MTTLLRIGCRPGWPGSKISEYVTHAVYRISPISSLGLQRGYIKGYGRPNSTGVVVLDGATVSGVKYEWFDPELYLEDDDATYFEDRVLHHCGEITYTGIGANCYTPIVLALGDLVERMRGNNAETSEIVDAERVLQQLMGSNYGIGTRITNQGIQSGLSLFLGLGIFMFGLKLAVKYGK